jgi:hypothetical protein
MAANLSTSCKVPQQSAPKKELPPELAAMNELRGPDLARLRAIYEQPTRICHDKLYCRLLQAEMLGRIEAAIAATEPGDELAPTLVALHEHYKSHPMH